MERWQRMAERQGNAPQDDLPLVLAREGHHGPVIHAANRVSRNMGITVGARVVDMRAICPELQVAFADQGGGPRCIGSSCAFGRDVGALGR